MDFSNITEDIAKELRKGSSGMFSEDGEALPNPDCIRKLLLSIREIIFPRLTQGENSLEERLSEVASLLFRECSLCYLGTGESAEEAKEKGMNATEAFLKEREDVQA